MKSSVVKLSDGFLYVIANKIKYNNKKYVQLLRIDDESDFLFAENVGKELLFVEDDNLKILLVEEIAKSFQIQEKQKNKKE